MVAGYTRKDPAPGVKYIPPIFLIISDGVSTDNLRRARKLIRTYIASEKLSVIPVAVGEAGVGAFQRLGQGMETRQIAYSEYSSFFENFADELLYRIENSMTEQSDIDSGKDDTQQYFTAIPVQ
jgi:uncharacterized protein YegL